MADMGKILYVDRDKDIRELVSEVTGKDFKFELLGSENLEKAEDILKGEGISGMIIDEQISKQKELLDFIEKAKGRYPSLSIAVLFAAVDMVLESEFRDALKKQGVRVVAKTEALRYEKIGELLKWCVSQKMGG